MAANSISFGYQNPLTLLWEKSFYQRIPSEPGVYFFLDDGGRPLYIGKANCLRKRVMSYANAKPGQSYEHTLEMLEHVQSIKWELHPTGAAALARESELLRVIRPPFNVAGTEGLPFLYCGIRAQKPQRRSAAGAMTAVEFRLSHHQENEGFKMYGCFPHRGKTKAGYSALLRLIAAAGDFSHRLHLPAKLCRTTPAYVHRMGVPSEWIASLDRFLAGEDTELLALIFARLMDRESLSPILYAPLQRDFKAAREFFASGPSAARTLRRKARIRSKLMTQKQMDRLMRDRVWKSALGLELKGPRA